MQDRFQKDWDDSYGRRENTLFYPQEDVIRFVSKYLRRKVGPDTYDRDFATPPVVLDLGCGAGRHLLYLYENGFSPIGVELSETACAQARALLSARNVPENAVRIIHGSAADLPLDDGSVDHAISVSAIDSMPTNAAVAAVREVHRVLKPGGLFCVDLIDTEVMRAGSVDQSHDQIVDETHEKGTVQSYYDRAKIARVFQHFHERGAYRIKHETRDGTLYASRWHLVLERA
ncbi:MAG: class I SAM-dependent methyltransferase [Halocynthiibacter sp.]